MLMRTSIVIPTLNEENYVGFVLSDIARQTRKADEMIVVDGRSQDATSSVVERFPWVDLLIGAPPVANQRNLGGRKASGDILIFLDADVRLSETFLEDFLKRIKQRNLDIACPLYMPYRSTLLIKVIHAYVNVVFVALQKVIPSGAGHCIAVKRQVFQQSPGFDPTLKLGEDVALVRKLSKGHRFGIVAKQLFVSDRRYKEEGVSRMLTKILLLSIILTFGKGNEFCKKITYRAQEKSETLISEFRTSPVLRIAVTVDMISTGTDVKPLEVLIFMRDVKSQTYYEQMVGRGTRTISETDLQAVTGDASRKTHFVLIDAIGVTETAKGTDVRPLERKPTVAFDNLLLMVTQGC